MLRKIYQSRINKDDKSALKFMILNLASRVVSAIAQFYAITVFLKHHTPNSASVIILLLGYLSWFQLFELGLSQTIQNRFNLKRLSLNNIINIMLMHYALMIIIGFVVINTTVLSNLLLNASAGGFTPSDKINFSIGAAVLILASSTNLILHRILLITRKGNTSNLILLLQSIFIISALYIYNKSVWISQLNSILVYTLPQLLTTLPIIVYLTHRKIRLSRKKTRALNFKEIGTNAMKFFLISSLSSALLGLDYFMLSHYTKSNDIIEYHVTTRFFFLSFITYYAYLTYSMKNIATAATVEHTINIYRIKINAIIIGSLSVVAVYLLMLTLKSTNYISIITNKTEISYSIIFLAFIYYMIRVYCDTTLVINSNLEHKKELVKTYSTQILVSILLMPVLCEAYSGKGILISLSIAYLAGLPFQPKIKKC